MDVKNAPGLLRFVTAGSVDDGKSTLIGRLLFDSKSLMVDQIEAIGRAKHARADAGALDLALATDGLEAEREQGITIDVAYRYFATPKRSFIIADAPGHEQYTRNLVTAASTADVAIILVDASRSAGKALKVQTRRHTTLAHMLGLRLVVAINKMDAVNWAQGVFEELSAKVESLARSLGATIEAIVPISAKSGDNVVIAGTCCDWYTGPTLLTVLENAPLKFKHASQQMRFPVQRIARDGTERLYQGRLESGTLGLGDTIVVLPSGQKSTVTRLLNFDQPIETAQTGQSVSLGLADDLDIARGDTLASVDAKTASHFTADICWLDQRPWTKGTKYVLKQGTQSGPARIEDIVFVRDMVGLTEIEVPETLGLNDIASVQLRSQAPLVADTYDALPGTGAFILIDPVSNQTAAAGMIRMAH